MLFYARALPGPGPPWKMDKLEGTAERTHRSVWFSMVHFSMSQCRTVPRIRNFPLLGCGHLQSRARFRLGKVNNTGITWNHKTCFEMFSTYFNISMIFMLCVTMTQWYLVISKSPVLMQNPTSPSCQVRCRWFSSYQRLWKDPGMCHLNCIWIIWHIWHFHGIFGQVSHWKQRNLMRPADSCRFLRWIRLQAVMMANICLQTYLVSNLSALLTRADVGIYTMRFLARKLHIRITVWQHEGLQLASISTSSSNIRSSWMFLVVVVIAYIPWTIPEQ